MELLEGFIMQLCFILVMVFGGKKSSMDATLLGCFDVISIYFIIFAPELKHFELWLNIIR